MTKKMRSSVLTMTMMTKSNAYSIKLRSPSGTIFVVISEGDNGRPIMVQIYLGKTGSNLFAYLNAIGELITALLKVDKSIDDVITLLSNTTADKLVYNGNIPIRSDIDAIIYALLRYKKEKFIELSPPQKRILNQHG